MTPPEQYPERRPDVPPEHPSDHPTERPSARPTASLGDDAPPPGFAPAPAPSSVPPPAPAPAPAWTAFAPVGDPPVGHASGDGHNGASEPTGALQSPHPRRSRRGPVIAGFVLAGLVIAALAAGVVYLWGIHSEYVAQNEALRATALSMGEDLATERAATADRDAAIVELQGELDEAKRSISDIVNGEAHASDDVQALSDLMSGMIECANARQELANHLWEKERWTTASLRANETSVNDFCANIELLYTAFKDKA